jgi:uncharacterized membrane protein
VDRAQQHDPLHQVRDAASIRLNLVLLLFVSFLPFTTSLLAVHLNDAGEDVAAVIFGANLTLTALLVNTLVAHAARTPGLAADDVAEEELQAFAKERRAALLLQAIATVVGRFSPSSLSSSSWRFPCYCWSTRCGGPGGEGANTHGAR